MVTVYTCQNGVRIVSEHIPYVRSVSIGIWVGAGSRYELPEENGITHFIEHMLFKGTQTRSVRQIAEEFDQIGGEVNAFTSKENTCYYVKVLDHHGKKAISILADMFFHSLFSKEELEKERQVVLEEILMSEDAPDDDIHEQLWHVMYPNDSLGLPILGTKKTLLTFTDEKIHQYMEKYYNPENVVISVAGNISKELLLHIETLFGKFTRNQNAIQPKLTYPQFHDGTILKERDIEQSHIALSFPAICVSHPQIFSLVTLNNILGGSMSSRLFQEVREERGLAYSIYSYHSSFSDVGALVIYGSTNNEQRYLLKEMMEKSLEKLKHEGVKETELANAKEQLKGSFVLGLESTNSRMSRNGKNELIHGRYKTLDEVIAEIDQVSKQSVDELTEKILSSNPAVAMIGKGL